MAGGGPGRQRADRESQEGASKARKPKAQIIALGAAAALVAAAAGTYALTHSGAGQSAVSTAAHVQVGHAAAPKAQSLTVLSVTSAAGTRHVIGGEPIEVQFSVPLAAGSPPPVLRPAIAGRWSIAGATMTFTPDEPFRPGAQVTLRVPAGEHGVRSATGSQLAAAVVTRFRAAPYSGLRLAELLAQLGYLPLNWAPVAGTGHFAEDASAGQSQTALVYSPPAGTFTWRKGYPYALTSQWAPTTSDVVVRGAVMAFQYQHGLTPNGEIGPKFWSALFRAAARGQRNAVGYTYALASKALPETLTIWHDGRQVFRSLANTGIPVSPTADGTFPVYLKYRFQIMQGTNPDGSTYADPVSFVSYFNGGDAVHYFPRGSYGFQQSLGCVELPYGAAEQAYPYLTYGSLVTVSG